MYVRNYNDRLIDSIPWHESFLFFVYIYLFCILRCSTCFYKDSNLDLL